MGNEFGHPEWIDFPGKHNNWSYHYARRQWGLVKNQELRYRYLYNFDKAMIGFFATKDIINRQLHYPRVQNNGDQVLVFERGDHLFVFNFNPFKSYTDYSFDAFPGDYQVVLDSDASEFGGHQRQDHLTTHHTIVNSENKPVLSLYIPSLTGFVLKRSKGQ